MIPDRRGHSWGGIKMKHCVLAVEKDAAEVIRNNLLQMERFAGWKFDICEHTNQLDHYSRESPDVLVLSRFLPGEEPGKLLKHINTLFPGSHIVLLVGELDESCRGYLRVAKHYELANYVTGKLPGDRPYTLMVALTATRDPGDEFMFDDEQIQAPAERPEPVMENKPEAPLETEPPRAKRHPGNLLQPAPEKHNPACAMKSRQEHFGYETANEPVYRNQPGNYPEQHHKPGIMTQGHGQAPVQYTQPPLGQPLPRRERHAGNYRGKLILTVANKGGVGKTTTAITVAMALASAGIEVIIVDLNLAGPSIHTFFDIKPERGIEALGGNNMILLDRVLIGAPKQENLTILPGPMDKTVLPDSMFEHGELANLFGTLLSMAQVVIVDTPSNFWDRPWIPEVFEMADMVLAVVDQSKFSEMDTRDHAPKILLMGVSPEKIKIVLNKFSPKLHNAKVVEKAFNGKFKSDVQKNMLPKVIATIPADWDKHNLLGYKGKAAGLDDHRSQWHRLAEEVAHLAGLRYDGQDKQHGNKKSLLGLLKRG